jgi:hypothetical protein
LPPIHPDFHAASELSFRGAAVRTEAAVRGRAPAGSMVVEEFLQRET